MKREEIEIKRENNQKARLQMQRKEQIAILSGTRERVVEKGIKRIKHTKLHLREFAFIQWKTADKTAETVARAKEERSSKELAAILQKKTPKQPVGIKSWGKESWII